jgi:hypothetical protein
MSGSLARRFYCGLLRLYPQPFRHEFGEEMLSVVDSCRETRGHWCLLIDVLLSAARQQISYHSTPDPTGSLLYSEVSLSLGFRPKLGVVTISLVLVASLWSGRVAEKAVPWTFAQPEVIYWFPTIPQRLTCSRGSNYLQGPERIRETGVWMRISSEHTEFVTVVRSQTGFWISSTPWGQYCGDSSKLRGKQEEIQ